MERIVRRGGIEDIVSKERISRHFGTAVDHVLASKTTIFVSDVETVIELTKRMPQLRKLTSDHFYVEDAEELARNNPGITKFVSSPSGREMFVPAYIKCVKQLNPEYTASEIRNILDYGQEGTVVRQVVDDLIADHPDLQIKIEMDADDISHTDTVIVELVVKITLDSGEEITDLPILPKVTKVKLLNNRLESKNNLRSFPNMCKLWLFNMYDYGEICNLNDLHFYLGDKVESVEINYLPERDLSNIESLINNLPLVKLAVNSRLEGVNEIALSSFMEMLINSRNDTLKKVKLGEIMEIKGSRMNCYLDRDCSNLITQLLSKFPKVTFLDLTVQRSNLGNWSEVAQEILAADHRRSIMLTIKGDEVVRY